MEVKLSEKIIAEQGFYLVTPSVKTDEEAVEAKMKSVQSKLFGIFSPVKYELIEKRKVYVPYEFLAFSYEIKRGKMAFGKEGQFDREGKVGIIFDLNEVHAFPFDMMESLVLEKDTDLTAKGELLSDNCTPERAYTLSLETVRWKMLHRAFRDLGDVDLIKREKFYRSAWELKLSANNKEFIKYAYMDIYGVESEHVSGLKVRLEV